jgi:hypothetical protein
MPMEKPIYFLLSHNFLPVENVKLLPWESSPLSLCYKITYSVIDVVYSRLKINHICAFIPEYTVRLGTVVVLPTPSAPSTSRVLFGDLAFNPTISWTVLGGRIYPKATTFLCGNAIMFINNIFYSHWHIWKCTHTVVFILFLRYMWYNEVTSTHLGADT